MGYTYFSSEVCRICLFSSHFRALIGQHSGCEGWFSRHFGALRGQHSGILDFHRTASFYRGQAYSRLKNSPPPFFASGASFVECRLKDRETRSSAVRLELPLRNSAPRVNSVCIAHHFGALRVKHPEPSAAVRWKKIGLVLLRLPEQRLAFVG